MGDHKNKAGDKRKEGAKVQSVVAEYGKAIILAVVLALFERSFILQAFQIPSGSMIPTLLEGDRVLVEKFAYGIRNPFNNKVWIETGKPERGDVVVFIYPKEPDKDYVKRVIGLPGDTVTLAGGELYINDERVPDPGAHYDPLFPSETRNFRPTLVPEGKYFMMGDNRDHSSDSRTWGFVDESLLRGKAWRLYWSWDSSDPEKGFFSRLRLSRIGDKIK